MLQHLSPWCRINPVKVDADRATAADVVRDLAVRIHPDLRPDPVDDPTKRLRYWALWLVEQARRAQGRPWWWFVFDQCNELDPGSDVVEFIAQLAIAIKEMTPAPGEKRPRLILLGYDEHLADIPLPRKQVHPDQVRRASESDVRTFFTGYLNKVSRPVNGTEPIDDAARSIRVGCRRPGPRCGAPGRGRRAPTCKPSVPRPKEPSMSSPLDRSPEGVADRLRERLQAHQLEESRVAPERQAYRKAASLLTTFDPTTLRTPEDTVAGGAVLQLVDDSTTRGGLTGAEWSLKPEVRDRALRSFSGPDEALRALETNIDRYPEDSTERIELGFLRGELPDLETADTDTLCRVREAVGRLRPGSRSHRLALR